MIEILTSLDKVLLNTSLSEVMFAKTKFSNHLEESGYIVKNSNNDEYSVSDFTSWKFQGSSTIDGTVFLEGKFSNAKTVSSILADTNETEFTKKLLHSIVRIYTFAIENSINLPANSIFGILYNEKDNSFLFIPEKTFDSCMKNLGKENYTLEQEPWRDSALTGKAALDFARAVLSYFMLTKKLPYPAKRNEDKSTSISYSDFLPLEYSINGINIKLAERINSSLKIEKKNENSNFDFPADILLEEVFHSEKRTVTISEEEFKQKVQIFIAKQQKKIKNKKNFNKWFPTAMIAFVLIAFTSMFTFCAVSENGKKPCTIGLSSEETTKLFYQGIHHMDTDFMLASAKNCPEAQGYISRIPQIYVAGNMRSAFNFESGISTPENWMFFEPDTTRSYSHFIYGITNFTIDGNTSTLNKKAPTRKNHKPKLYHINGERLSDLSKAQHTVQYYLVHNVDQTIQIEQFTTIVHLKWNKDRWQISHLEETNTIESISPLPYSLDYKNALSAYNNDVIDAVSSLKEKYPWVPSDASLKEEQERLDSIGY